jgi:hypothetical protein
MLFRHPNCGCRPHVSCRHHQARSRAYLGPRQRTQGEAETRRSSRDQGGKMGY